MKQQQNEILEQRGTNMTHRKTKVPDVKGRKYNGTPYMKFKKVKAEPRQRIRQVLRACLPLNKLRNGGKPSLLPGQV